MIDAKLMRKDGILIVSPTGNLESADFERLRLLVDPYIEAHGVLKGLLIDAESFSGWEDFSSLLSHVRFVRDHQTRIDRVAAVTDSGFLAVLPRIADYFVSAEVRHYDFRHRDEALRWLRGGD